MGKTFEEKDYSAFNFLQWYVAEQHEEEKLFNSIIDKFNLLGEDGRSLYFIDRDLATYHCRKLKSRIVFVCRSYFKLLSDL